MFVGMINTASLPTKILYHFLSKDDGGCNINIHAPNYTASSRRRRVFFIYLHRQLCKKLKSHWRKFRSKQSWRRHVIVYVKTGGLKLLKTWLSCWIAPLIKACLAWACSASGFVIVLSKKSSKLCQLLEEVAARFRISVAEHLNCQTHCVSSRTFYRNVMTHEVTITFFRQIPEFMGNRASY